VRAVAVQVLDEDVGAVGLECDAVYIQSVSLLRDSREINIPSPLLITEF
jgi:hypothetical protein